MTSAVDHPELLDETLWHLEEPIADVSCSRHDAAEQLARESVTVALSGQGADEILAGYRKHEIAYAASRLRGALAPLRPLAYAGRANRARRARRSAGDWARSARPTRSSGC